MDGEFCQTPYVNEARREVNSLIWTRSGILACVGYYHYYYYYYYYYYYHRYYRCCFC